MFILTDHSRSSPNFPSQYPPTPRGQASSTRDDVSRRSNTQTRNSSTQNEAIYLKKIADMESQLRLQIQQNASQGAELAKAWNSNMQLTTERNQSRSQTQVEQHEEAARQRLQTERDRGNLRWQQVII